MTEIIEDKKILKVCVRCKKEKKIRCKGMCKTCGEILRKLKKYKDAPLKKCECKPDCPAMIRAWGRFGNPLKYKKGHYPSGKDHHCYKTGIHKDKDGYILENAPDHPFRNANNQVRQHRLVYEHYLYILFDEHIYIPQDIHIDHINGIRDDNRIINLRPISPADHNSYHKKKYGSNPRCSDPECKSPNETYMRKNGYPMWIVDKLGNVFCNKCNRKRKD